ncbi:type II toxin-antitoxin system RelE/ParE family toxin [Candidatus Falkowbacteria bacterium]|jgi:toxin ParE1/3/4|nr:type II toxin-antitoxin system RelE/ParE family toxin [Deltaproteobacteria bacterium]MBT4525424.1 type II toxin-antitoxin system RelE/ParE family toxin [Deltaproteobacteria bacterium]MBT7007085.1 type II toxin-antitoxin system RelE/ParE family toxin [Candidatus Falkowbacteria bacterium]
MSNRYKVIWSKTAKLDLETIIEYIAEDSITNALNILSKIKTKTSVLVNYPMRGRIVPELKEYNILQYREIIYKPWRIIYKIAENKVYVVSVIDGRRNVEDVLLDRLINQK